jgi:hypothetical protein
MINELKSGLVRAQGKIKMTRLPSESTEPVLEIEADSVFIADNS